MIDISLADIYFIIWIFIALPIMLIGLIMWADQQKNKRRKLWLGMIIFSIILMIIFIPLFITQGNVEIDEKHKHLDSLSCKELHKIILDDPNEKTIYATKLILEKCIKP